MGRCPQAGESQLCWGQYRHVGTMPVTPPHPKLLLPLTARHGDTGIQIERHDDALSEPENSLDLGYRGSMSGQQGPCRCREWMWERWFHPVMG